MNVKINKYHFWKRIIDIILAVIGIIILIIPLSVICIIIKITSKGPIIHWADRIGIKDKCFKMAKLRTLKTDTPEISSNLINSENYYFIRFGKILRSTGIDELPQLYNIIKGDMSFVGPRPVITIESDIISERKKRGIDKIRPGLTGLAQINGREKLSVFNKVKYDEIYMQNMNLLLDLKIIFLTNYWLLRENIPSKKISEYKNSWE